MKQIEEAMNLCLIRLRSSSDFNDSSTTTAFEALLSAIIANPKYIVNFPEEEKLSLVISSIMTSPFPNTHQEYKGVDVKMLLFMCGYYLYMHQLEFSKFYDKNWPAFILLLHLGKFEFSSFYKDMKSNLIVSYKEVNATELTCMVTAKKKGFLTEELVPWYEELLIDADNLLKNYSFNNIAIPLYRYIATKLSDNDLSLVM